MPTLYRMFISDDGMDFDESQMVVFGCNVRVLEDGTRLAYSDVTVEELVNAFLNKQAILWVVEDPDSLPN